MPTIIVEDGTGVTDANSYVDLTYLNQYATDRGLTLPTLDADKEIFLLLANDYLEARRSEYQGSKTASSQSLQWPRSDVYLDGTLIADTVIPEILKKAQCQLVVEQQKRTLLFPRPRQSSTEGLVTQKTLGPLTKKYSFEGRGLVNPAKPIVIASVETFLKPLFDGCGSYKKTLRA